MNKERKAGRWTMAVAAKAADQFAEMVSIWACMLFACMRVCVCVCVWGLVGLFLHLYYAGLEISYLP